MNELPKYLCLLLRHQPEKAELDMDEHGWVNSLKIQERHLMRNTLRR